MPYFAKFSLQVFSWQCLSILYSAPLIVGSVTTATCQTLEPLKKALAKAGYQLHDAPRSNWGPGFVFAGDVIQGQIKNVEEICPNLYGDPEAPQSADVLLPSYNAEDGFTFGIAIHFLKGLFGIGLGIDQIQREQKISITWQNIKEFSYAYMDTWLANGEPRPIDRRCRLAVDDLKAKQRFEDRVFVIVRAVAPESLIYDFSRAVTAQGSASAQLWQEIQANAHGQGEIKTGTHLEIKRPLFIGYSFPIKIKDWLPTGQVSGEIAKVRGVQTGLTIE